MQNVAREMNLSETAFLCPAENGYNLRWFTPKVEVALCGHATLASAHVLWTEGSLAPDEQARFFTKSGPLYASRKPDGWIELDFPQNRVQETETPKGLAEALGVEFIFTAQDQRYCLVEVSSEETLRNLAPNFSLLSQVKVRAVIVTARSETSGLDFVSRFFAPSVGINEDPVTGSAHTVLGPYWRDRLGKNEFMAYQASERGGFLGLRMSEDRVFISGQAVTVMAGELA